MHSVGRIPRQAATPAADAVIRLEIVISLMLIKKRGIHLTQVVAKYEAFRVPSLILVQAPSPETPK